VGDATRNPKNNFDSTFGQDSKTDYLPAYLTYTEYMGETVTDDWYARVSGDDAVADLYIGRLPADDAEDAAAMTAKIVAYENAPNSKTWQKDILLVADDQVKDFESVFETINEDAAAVIPAGMNPPGRGYLGDYLAEGFSAADLKTDLKDQIDAGTLIVNFSGHGSLQTWADERIFENADVADLANADALPFVVSMNCLTGYFAYPEPESLKPYVQSMAEVLLRTPATGAAAALMPTGMTTTEGQHVLNTALFEALFTEDVRRLGDALTRAKMTLLANGENDYLDVSQTFLLFGDPAMALKIPLPHRPTGLSAAQTAADTVYLSWQSVLDADGQAVAGYYPYRATSATGPYSKISPAPVGDAHFEDLAVAIGTRYYYTVTSVDDSGIESVHSPSVSIVPAAQIRTAGNPGSSGGGGGGCFISTVEATEASFFVTEWPISSLFGLLALIGLLWLGNKKAKGKRQKAKGKLRIEHRA